MKISATFVWRNSVSAEVPDNATEQEQRQALKQQLMLSFNANKFEREVEQEEVFSDGSNEPLID